MATEHGWPQGLQTTGRSRITDVTDLEAGLGFEAPIPLEDLPRMSMDSWTRNGALLSQAAEHSDRIREDISRGM